MDLVVGRSSPNSVKGNTLCIFSHDYDVNDPELKDIQVLAVFFKHGSKTSEVLEKLGHPAQARVFGWVDQTPGEVTSAITSWLTPNAPINARFSFEGNLNSGQNKEESCLQKPKRTRPTRQPPRPGDE
jgi:hypothetical protein